MDLEFRITAKNNVYKKVFCWEWERLDLSGLVASGGLSRTR